MKVNNLKYLVPNGISFLSLTCGLVSILAASSNQIALAAGLVLASYILDLFDGAMARRLNAGSEFGLQLDSLVDMVSLGVAPMVVVFFHLQNEGIGGVWVWPVVMLIPLAGAFRLARFNLLPAKEESRDSMGLTISTGGSTPALAVLTDVAGRSEFIPDWLYVPMVIIMALLMVSTIRFPPFKWLFQQGKISYALVLSAGISIALLGFVNAWWLYNGGYLGVSLARAGYRSWNA